MADWRGIKKREGHGRGGKTDMPLCEPFLRYLLTYLLQLSEVFYDDFTELL